MMNMIHKRLYTKTAKGGEFGVIRALDKEPNYVLLGDSGEGASGKVHRARRKSKLIGGLYAIKICAISDEQTQGTSTHSSDTEEEKAELPEATHKSLKVTLETCEAEIRILRVLQTARNRRVVHLYDCFQYENQVWMVMEYMPFDLRQMLWLRYKQDEPRLLVWDAAVYIREIARGLQFLHSKRVVHKDLKPANVLLSNLGNVKLCDFGISEQIPECQDKPIVDRSNGTRQYMASEMFQKGNEYDYSVDIWALGIILHNLCHHGQPLIDVQFYNEHFEAYQRGFYHYIKRMCTDAGQLLTLQQEEIVRGKKVSRNALTELFFVRDPYEPIRDFVFAALVPYPSTGTKKYPVTRKVTRKRMTLEEALKWADIKLEGRSELDCRNVVIQHVRQCTVLEKEIKDEIRRAKEVGGRIERKVMQHYFGRTTSEYSILDSDENEDLEATI